MKLQTSHRHVVKDSLSCLSYTGTFDIVQVFPAL